MREDLPARELQDLRPAPGDGEVSPRWARSVNRACTAWLLERGLLGSPSEYRYPDMGASAPEENEPANGEAAKPGAAGAPAWVAVEAETTDPKVDQIPVEPISKEEAP